MSDAITIIGLVTTRPRHIIASGGLAISSFRLASTQRRCDTAAEKWIDGETDWYTATCFRQFATQVAESVNKSDRIVVVGKLRVREWEAEVHSGVQK
jgi:single-strand DNA-binding protein